MIRIVGLNGSLRPGSHSKQALQLALGNAKRLGASVELLDLQVLRLPFCNGGDVYPEYPDVEYLKSTVREADGLILATPEYHGSVSGVLKNALDLMGFEELSGKVTAAISILGGQSNSNALNDLRIITRWVHAWMIPEQVAIGQAWKAFDAEGNITDPKLAGRLEELAKSLVDTARRLRSETEAIAS
ncbi:NADPH-dependent FMN reductase [Altericista sp. CCNU0014]|uniref:NADPH-dependent FMN reductase n=1 Tax=Altericista sp. CCNU0014 TaxID=3082949 RepID=UPI00384A6DB7